MKIKRIASAFLVAAMCAQIVNIPANAKTAAKREILFFDSFGGYATNDIPEKGIYLADDLHVIDRVPNKDKAVSFRIGTLTSAKYDFSESVSNAVMSFDIRLSGAPVEIKFLLVDSNGKTYTTLKQGSDGRLTTVSGCPVSGIGRQVWNNMTVAYNGKDKSYDAYINGKKVAKRWAISSGPDKISGFKLEFLGNDESRCEIDNVISYKGIEIIQTSSLNTGKYVSGYNSEEIEYIPEDDEEGSEEEVVFRRTFEETDIDDLYGIAPQDRSGLSEIYVDTDIATGNRYLKHHVNGNTTDCYSVFSIKTQTSHVVVQMDFKQGKNPFDGLAFRPLNERGAASSVWSIFTLKNGSVSVPVDGASQTFSFTPDSWTNIAFAMNKKSRKYDVYLNGELKIENAGPYADDAFGELSAMMIYTWTSGKDDDIFFDNIYAYDGKTPRTISADEEVHRTSILISNEYSEKLLKNSVSVHDSSDYIFYDNKRHTKTLPGYKNADGVLMEAAEELEKAFGFTAETDLENGVIKINDTELTAGSRNVRINGRDQKLTAPPEIKDGKFYIPFADVAEQLLGKKLFYDGRGIYVATDRTFKLEEKDIKAVNDYMLYPRYEPEDIKELFQGKENMHPRVLINSDGVAEMRRKYNENEYMHNVGDQIIKVADGLVEKTISPPKFDPTGQLLNQARTIYSRMCNLGAAYLLTGDKKYVDRAWIDLEAVCGDAYPEWRLWHLITASEMAVGVAIAYDWMYDEWTEEQRLFIEEALMEKYVVPSERKYFMGNALYYHVADGTNRGIVNNGGSVVLGIAMFDKDPDLCASLISCGLRAMEYAEDMFYPDGAWHEGVGYWVYMSDYLVNTVSTIEATFGTDFNILNTPGMDKSVYFSVYSTGPTGCDNFEDAHYNSGQTPVYMWYARKYNLPGIAKLRRFNTNDSGEVKDLLYYDTEWDSEEIESLPLDKTFGGIEYVSMRGSFFEKDTTYLGFHGGKAHTSHGHLDNGTFVVDMLGERWAWDLADSNYAFVDQHKDQQYFIYERSPEGHNCLVINPTGDSYYQNTESVSYITKLESRPKGAYAVIDLTTAYSENADNAIRGYRLTDERRSVEIRDELQLKSESDVYWFMQTKADVQIAENGREAILEQNGKRVKLSFITDAPDAELTAEKPAGPLEVTPVIEGQSEKTAYTRIAIKLSGKKNMYIHVRMIPENDSAANNEIENVSISDWTIPDGEVEPVPQLDMIYCNGQPVSEFEPTKITYDFLVENLETSPFEITAVGGENYYVDITEDKTDEMIVKKVKAISRNNPNLYREYIVTAEQPKELPDVGGMKRLPVYGYAVSNEIEEANNRYNANDNDLSTRFTMEGKNEWLCYDLGKEQRIDGIGVAVWKSNERNTVYDIYVSNDNESWTKIYSGGNEGKADEIELKSITPVTARYVKLVGMGSNVNAYTNILELAVLQNK